MIVIAQNMLRGRPLLLANNRDDAAPCFELTGAALTAYRKAKVLTREFLEAGYIGQGVLEGRACMRCGAADLWPSGHNSMGVLGVCDTCDYAGVYDTTD